MSETKPFLLAVIAIAIAIVGATVSPQVMDIISTLLVVGAVTSSVNAYRCMSLSIILKCLNPHLAIGGSASGMIAWLVLLVGSVRLVGTLRLVHLRLVAPVWVFALIAFVLSCFTSPAIIVSILKVLTLVIVSTGVLCGLQVLPIADMAKVKTWLFALAVAVTVLSLALLSRPDISYSVIKTSFQGIFYQPQTLGTFLAPFAAWTLCGIVMLRRRPKVLELVFLGLVWTAMLLSLARTAAVAAMSGVVVALLFRFISGRRSVEQAGFGKLAVLCAAGIAAVGVTIVATDTIRTSVTSFVLKRDARSLDEAFSRSGLMKSQWENFLRKPLTGYGFGVYADGSFRDGVIEIGGIPISAPVEKGFIPTAVLEETGIFGALAFWFFIFRLGVHAFRSTDLRWVAVFCAAITVNMGEAVLLSPGGVGLHIWLLISFAAAAHRLGPASRHKDGVERVESIDLASIKFSNLLH